jgi:hypothetical protein
MITARTMSLAHAVPIDRVINERGISLRGKVERVGPCPICGGRDRPNNLPPWRSAAGCNSSSVSKGTLKCS